MNECVFCKYKILLLMCEVCMQAIYTYRKGYYGKHVPQVAYL